MAFASRAIPIAYRTSTMGFRSPDRMPIDRPRYELEPITSLRDMSWGDMRSMSSRNLNRLRTDTPPVLSRPSRSASSLFHTPTPGTPSFLSREGRKSSSPTFASRCECGRTHPRTPCVLRSLERSGSQSTSHLILTSHLTLCLDKAASRAIRWSGNPQGATCSRFHGTIRRSCASRSNHQGWWPLFAPTRLLCFDRDRATNRRRSFIS